MYTYLSKYVILCVKILRIQSYSGLHFAAFRLNTERYKVPLRSQLECGRMRTRIIPNTDTFFAVIQNKQRAIFVTPKGVYFFSCMIFILQGTQGSVNRD